MRRRLWLGIQAFQELFPQEAVSQICLSIKEEIYEVERYRRDKLAWGEGGEEYLLYCGQNFHKLHNS